MPKQPVKNIIKYKFQSKQKKETEIKKNEKVKIGTSKLEDLFAKNFLDKLGVKYIRQFKAESIGRYFDFRIIPNGPIIEINGGYWHGDPRLYEEKDLNKIQIKTQRIDEYKRKWALIHCIPIYYFWEYDIHNNPNKVMNELKNILFPPKKTRLDFYKKKI